MRTNYKKIEIEIRELVKQGQATAWEIATRCRTLLDESDSYAVAIGIKPDEVTTHLDDYLSDYCVNLSSIVTMLQVFPKKEQWNKRLGVLLNEARATIKASEKADQENGPRVIQRAKMADLEQAKQEIKTAETRAVRAESEVDQLRKQIADLTTENDKLRQQIATLKGQIAELRRNREPATV